MFQFLIIRLSTIVLLFTQGVKKTSKDIFPNFQHKIQKYFLCVLQSSYNFSASHLKDVLTVGNTNPLT